MKGFAFNLIPKKSKQEIVKETKRDNASVYTALLPLVAVVVWLGLVLFNGLVVDKVREDWQAAVDQKTARIASEFLAVRLQHGELVVKTNALANLVSKDIKPETLFILTEKIFPTEEADVLIVGYGRDEDGSFNVTLATPSYEKFAQITRRFANYPGAQKVSITAVNGIEDNEGVIGVINFFIDEEYVLDDDA